MLDIGSRSLNDDQDIQRFVAGIPGFCSSTVAEDAVGCIARLGDKGLSEALVFVYAPHLREVESALIDKVGVMSSYLCAPTNVIDKAPVLEHIVTTSGE